MNPRATKTGGSKCKQSRTWTRDWSTLAVYQRRGKLVVTADNLLAADHSVFGLVILGDSEVFVSTNSYDFILLWISEYFGGVFGVFGCVVSGFLITVLALDYEMDPVHDINLRK